MAFIVNKTTAAYIDEAAVDIQSGVPAGIWATSFNQFRGTFLEKYDYNTNHGKIYGKSQKIADHVFEAYQKSDRNVGVLLSGGKGLGKSLTARLVIEKAVNEKIPVIIVNDYLPDLVQFLKNVGNCVILFDEFEKTFGGKVDEESNDNHALTKQEEMLSLFDGTSVGSHNLYIMTVNETSDIDTNMKSRPGRIKYHYRYESEDEDTIRAYCADNLQKPNMEQSIVDALIANRYVSLDIIKALVEEINNFDVTVDEAMEYLNIETDRISVYGRVTFRAFGKEYTEDYGFGYYYPGRSTISCEPDVCDDEGECYSFNIVVPMKGKKIPTLGTIDVSDVAQIYNYETGKEKEKFDLHVLKVELYEEGAFTRADRVCAYSELTGE